MCWPPGSQYVNAGVQDTATSPQCTNGSQYASALPRFRGRHHSLPQGGHTQALIDGMHAHRLNENQGRANIRRNMDSLFLCDEFEALSDIAARLLELLLYHQRADELEDVRAVLQHLKLLVWGS